MWVRPYNSKRLVTLGLASPPCPHHTPCHACPVAKLFPRFPQVRRKFSSYSEFWLQSLDPTYAVSVPGQWCKCGQSMCVGKWVKVCGGVCPISFTQHHACDHFLVSLLPFFSLPSSPGHSTFQIIILSACKAVFLVCCCGSGHYSGSHLLLLAPLQSGFPKSFPL